MAYCAFCDAEFEPSTPKQIYHDESCRIQASRLKILERHRIKKIEKRQHKERLCAGGCGTRLSIYNDSQLCQQCLEHPKRIASVLKEIKEYFDYETHS